MEIDPQHTDVVVKTAAKTGRVLMAPKPLYKRKQAKAATIKATTALVVQLLHHIPIAVKTPARQDKAQIAADRRAGIDTALTGSRWMQRK